MLHGTLILLKFGYFMELTTSDILMLEYYYYNYNIFSFISDITISHN